jgi:hypothetical protein
MKAFGSSKSHTAPAQAAGILLPYGYCLGALLFWEGPYKGKYNFKVLKYTLEFDDLPQCFWLSDYANIRYYSGKL